MPSFSEVSKQRLATCDPRLQLILNEVIKYVDCIVLEGFRDREAQNAAVATGNSQKPWPTGKHNHSPSFAVDIAPYLPSATGKMDWGDLVAFGRLMGVVQTIATQQGTPVRFGLDWDGDFRTAGRDPDEHFLDAPHVELAAP